MSESFVSVDRSMLSGAPHVVGRRISVETVVDLKDDRATLHEGYDLDDETIDGVLRWANDQR